jgi:hypothetical protein
MAATACGRFVLVGHASADRERGRSKLLLLSAPSGAIVSELSGGIAGGVASVAFSRDGHFAACLGGDLLHRLYLYQSYTGSWGDPVLLCELQVSSANINLIAFLAFETASLPSFVPSEEAANSKDQQESKEPSPSALEEEDEEEAPALYDIATAGDGLIKFWTIRGQNVTQACGEYNNAAFAGAGQSARITQAAITALASYVGLGERAGGHAVTGDAEGNIYLWTGALSFRFAASSSTVLSCCCCCCCFLLFFYLPLLECLGNLQKNNGTFSKNGVYFAYLCPRHKNILKSCASGPQ